jgi:hypothetical protein
VVHCSDVRGVCTSAAAFQSTSIFHEPARAFTYMQAPARAGACMYVNDVRSPPTLLNLKARRWHPVPLAVPIVSVSSRGGLGRSQKHPYSVHRYRTRTYTILVVAGATLHAGERPSAPSTRQPLEEHKRGFFGKTGDSASGLRRSSRSDPPESLSRLIACSQRSQMTRTPTSKDLRKGSLTRIISSKSNSDSSGIKITLSFEGLFKPPIIDIS